MVSSKFRSAARTRRKAEEEWTRQWIAVQRRRVITAAAALAAAEKPPKKVCKKYKDPNPFSWEQHVRRLTEGEFRKRYRLDWDSFQELLRLLRPHLEFEEKSASVEGANGLTTGLPE
jgi:hypothetical protein